MWALNKLQDYRELSRGAVFPGKPTFTEENIGDLSGKVYVVTGASAGIGKATAELLLRAGARVWVIGRTQSKLDATREELSKVGGEVRTLVLKMEDPATIAADLKPLLESESQLDGVVHNAGMNYRGSFFACGHLDIITVNVLGPWTLQKYLDPLVLKAATTAPPGSVRIVWVASVAHYYSPQCGGIGWDNLSDETINGSLGFGIYGQTKAMNIYEAYLWAQEHKDSKVISVSVHPGIIESDIRRYAPHRNRNMAKLCSPAVNGGYAELAPLLSKEVTLEDTGSYYRPYGVKGRVRPDVDEAIKGPRGEKFLRWVNEEVERIEREGPQGPAVEGNPKAEVLTAPGTTNA